MKAIPVKYKGYETRSTLEGRIMVLLDGLGAKWGYEVEGYQAAKWYLPDFEVDASVPGGKLFIEAKTQLYEDDVKKIYSFMTEKPVYVINQIPKGDTLEEIWQNADRSRELGGIKAFDFGLVGYCVGERGWKGGLLVANPEGRIVIACLEELSNPESVDIKRTLDAYHRAISYKFDRVEEQTRVQINSEKPERKSKRVQLLLRPSVYEKVAAMAKANGTSLNDLVDQIFAQVHV